MIASPKRPTPMVTLMMIAIHAMKAPAMANIGRVRAASHSVSDNMPVAGTYESQDSGGRLIMCAENRMSRDSIPAASIISLRGGGWRFSWADSINIGAIATMPTASDRNHARQTSQNGAAV